MSEPATASAVPAPGHDIQPGSGIHDSRAECRPDDAPEVGASVTDSFRTQVTRGEEVVDPATWSGSVPVAQGIAPRVRIGRSRWFNLLWLLPIGFVVLLVAVATAKGLRGIPAVQQFIARYPGTVQPTGPASVTGTPLWVGVQHFLNLFLLLFVMRSGLQILSDHPRLYLTRHSTPGRDWFRIQKPVPTDPLWTSPGCSTPRAASPRTVPWARINRAETQVVKEQVAINGRLMSGG